MMSNCSSSVAAPARDSGGRQSKMRLAHSALIPKHQHNTGSSGRVAYETAELSRAPADQPASTAPPACWRQSSTLPGLRNKQPETTITLLVKCRIVGSVQGREVSEGVDSVSECHSAKVHEKNCSFDRFGRTHIRANLGISEWGKKLSPWLHRL